MGCWDGKLNYKIVSEDHNCYSSRYENIPCPACEFHKQLEEKKDKGEIVDFYPTGGRYEDFIIIKSIDKNTGIHTCVVTLSSKGIYEYDSEIDGLVVTTYGEATFYPLGEILWEGGASVHGAWKIRKNQTMLVIAYSEKEWERKTKNKFKVLYYDNPLRKYFHNNNFIVIRENNIIGYDKDGRRVYTKKTLLPKGKSKSGSFFLGKTTTGVPILTEKLSETSEYFVENLTNDRYTIAIPIEERRLFDLCKRGEK